MKNFYLFAYISIILVSNCFHNRVTYDRNATPGDKKEIKTHFFLVGLYPDRKFSVEELCGKDGIYQVHDMTNFEDGLLSCLTFGIYTPRTLEVTCIRQNK
ncbi:MAG: Bor family protein [Leptospiraceae bacterium]|nr:Bor family protein [Leptospiraceae bacterium]MCP5496722.1 Bor family protein [Leptospiraceae bacterium]